MAKRRCNTKTTKRKTHKHGGFFTGLPIPVPLPFPLNVLRNTGNVVGDKILTQMGMGLLGGTVFATGAPPPPAPRGRGKKR